MKIAIFWTGYVWLVTGTCLAEIWHEVICIDIDDKKIENLKKWIIPIYEPGLDKLVLGNYKKWRLSFSTNAINWIKFATVIFSAVWTPPDENYKADLKYVKQVAKTVWENMDEYKVFVNKSTVPVWTGEICKNIIKAELEKKWNIIDFDIVSNPEFLKEWTAVDDFMNPDRIICWIESENVKEIMEEVYNGFLTKENSLIFTDLKSSEIIKYAANSFLATKISFINEIANFSEIVWGNINDISKWIWLDPRIWNQFLEAWIWYWWSCLPKDVQALIETWKDYNYDFRIIKEAEYINKLQKTKVVDKLLDLITDIKSKKVSLWWASFKKNTDDIRDAASIEIINKLLELDVKEIKIYDPISMNNLKHKFSDNKKIIFCETKYDAIKSTDALLLITQWDEFKNINIEKIKQLMEWNIIIDWRNLWNKSDFQKKWFIYEWIGY